MYKGCEFIATLNHAALKQKKKKRIRVVILFTCIEIILSPLLVYVIHQLLQNMADYGTGWMLIKIDWSYTNAIKGLLIESQAKRLWLITEMLWGIAVIFLTMSHGPKIGVVDTRMITPDIETPIPAGNGQHGNERFLTESEKEKIFGVFEFNNRKEERPVGNGGVVVQMLKKKGKEIILYVKEEVHTLIIGASGSGKTRRVLLPTIWLQLICGVSIILSDVKGEIFYFTNLFAKAIGYSRIIFDLRNPKKSMHYNFLQPILDAIEQKDIAKAVDYTWDLVSVLVGEQKGEPIWYNGECASIAATILIVAMDAPENLRNLPNVYYFLAFMCEPDIYGEVPLSAYLKMLPDTHPAKAVFQQAKIAPYKTRSSFYTSALGTLRLFTNPNIAEITSKSDFCLKDIGREKTIFYMIIPDEKKTNYPLVSILITQAYMLQVELASENGLSLPVPTDYDIDELGNFPKIPVLPNIVSAGRSRGIRFNGVIQDFQQLEGKYKEDFKNIKANCQVKIYLKSDDPDTLKIISEGMGKYTVEVSSASTSISDGAGAGRKDSSNYSSSASLVGRELLTPAEVKRIKTPYLLCLATGEYPAVNILPDISEWKLNHLYGMGDKEHNKQLMIEQEAAREEHSIPEIQLWGIWKKYQEMEALDKEPFANDKEERISFLK